MITQRLDRKEYNLLPVISGDDVMRETNPGTYRLSTDGVTDASGSINIRTICKIRKNQYGQVIRSFEGVLLV